MKIKRLWAQVQWNTGVLMAIVFLGLFAAQFASAQEIPTSVYPAIGAPWTTMRAGSFESTPASARAQCEYMVEQSVSKALTIAKCERFESMLTAGQCYSVQVRDGVVHDFVSYKRPDGHQFVSAGVRKEHGSDTSALLCDLGDGVYGYFYTGSDKHCNNAAFVFLPPPPPQAKNCGFGKKEVVRQPSTNVNLQPFYSSGVYVPGVNVAVPGGLQYSSKIVCK